MLQREKIYTLEGFLYELSKYVKFSDKKDKNSKKDS